MGNVTEAMKENHLEWCLELLTGLYLVELRDLAMENRMVLSLGKRLGVEKVKRWTTKTELLTELQWRNKFQYRNQSYRWPRRSEELNLSFDDVRCIDEYFEFAVVSESNKRKVYLDIVNICDDNMIIVILVGDSSDARSRTSEAVFSRKISNNNGP